MKIDYNKLREIFQRDNAARKFLLNAPEEETIALWNQIGNGFSKLESRAECNEFLGIIANANGALSIKERKEVLKRFRDTYHHSLVGSIAGGNPLPISLSFDDYDFIKSAFLRSQKAQFTKTAREQTAQKLKELHKDGMSLEGRKAYLVETAKNTYPLKKKGKGDAIIHRTLKERSKLQKLKKFLTRTK
ncbi:MAG: hypothetical protein E7021_01655 [Alphaproteobacteria bacterium]|nr:hypothetical protein [Alphaproteobacteria bacterium]